jgi:hypothetical protein
MRTAGWLTLRRGGRPTPSFADASRVEACRGSSRPCGGAAPCSSDGPGAAFGGASRDGGGGCAAQH